MSRGKGRSAVAAAAYRSGDVITNEYDGVTHDYRAKRGIAHTEILLSENAPKEYANRAILWNAVERIEKAKNSQLAREVEIALPAELTREQNVALVRQYCKEQFVNAGMCADICIHDKDDGNPHAHIMLTMRPFEPDGSWGTKQRKEYILDSQGEKIYDPKKRQYKCRSVPTTDWNEQDKAEQWRAAWAQSVNAALEHHGYAERIDHRSYERQGTDQIPTIHLGVAAMQMERRGIATERGNTNREITISNKELRQTKARLDKLRKWIADEAKPDAPTLRNVLNEILQGGEPKSRYARIRDLQAAADTLSFMETHKISTIMELHRVVTEYYGQLSDIRSKAEPIERRMKTLDEHIKHGETLSKYRKVYGQHVQQKPKDREAIYESHRSELMLYESASRYMKEHLNGRTKIPMKEWRAKRSKLAAKNHALSAELRSLKDEIKKVETIRRHADDVQRAIAPRKLRAKGAEVSL
jgi:ATP-dependent exoDNAse (exonuclease V) alpha subunit